MGKLYLSVIVVALLCASFCYGDYYNPPDWREDLYFTHQTWEFNSDQAVDLMPDGGFINPFGDPLFNIAGDAVAWGSLVSERSGVWVMGGGDASIDIYIPNEQNRQLYKEIWLQMVIRTAIRQDDLLGMLLSPIIQVPDGPYEIAAIDYSFEPAPQDNQWYYFTAMYRIDPQPDWERLTFDFLIPDGKFLKLDELDIDTHCIPEPSAALLLLGGIAALLYRKRR